MYEREVRHFIDDIVDSIQAITEFTDGMDCETFVADRKTYSATLREFIVIGEAVARLPDEIKDQCPSVAWRLIKDFRNVIVHAYFGIDPEIVWDAVKKELPLLKAAMISLQKKIITTNLCRYLVINKYNNQKGFTLVQAVFILVVLSLLGVVMMRMIGVQSATSVFALQGARAYQAARSGLEWGAAQASNVDRTEDLLCDDTICNSDPSFQIDGFSVEVLCSCEDFQEGSIDIDVYQINATAEFGSYGSPDYVSRKVQMKVVFKEE